MGTCLCRRMTTVLSCLLISFALAAEEANKKGLNDTIVHLTETPIVQDAKRMGLNLGGPESWGAAQLLKNVLQNPGLESGEYGMVWHTHNSANGTRVPQDFWSTSWNNDSLSIGQPEGFWNGAQYEIVYGSATGRSGTVASFTHENDRYTWYFDQNGTVPDPWSVVFARQTFTKSFGGRVQSPNADITTVRPGSPGVQSMRASYPGASWQPVWTWYMDSYWRDGDKSAGKLLIVRGNWRLEFWAKAARSGDQMRAQFYREGEGNFIDRTFTLGNQWQKYSFDAFVPDGADPVGPYTQAQYHPVLVLAFYVVTPGAEIWVDDVSLSRTDWTNPTAFSDTFVNRLKELRPGVLRDWRQQFGASLDNELAEPFARKLTGWRPHERRATNWGYSLHEFLELCHEVGAEPWYSIPPTVTAQEMQNLTAYLCAPVSSGHPYALRRAALGRNAPWTDAFSEIHLEYGNELWGAASGSDPFFGGSLLGGLRLGTIAGNRFQVMRNSPYFNDAKLNLIIGGQNGWAPRQNEIMDTSTAHDDIALAPYFGALDVYDSNDNIYLPLFAKAMATAESRAQQSKTIIDSYGRGTKMSIYEINYHTTGGGAPDPLRNTFVAGASGGLSMPLYMLSFQRDLGINTQCAFTAAGYSFPYSGQNYVRLWGMLRDVEGTQRKRPTWLGLEMVNKAIFGDMVQTSLSGYVPTLSVGAINGLLSPQTFPSVAAFAYQNGFDHSVILFNVHLYDSRPIVLDHFRTPQNVATMHQFAPSSLSLSNEDTQQVTYTTSTVNGFSDMYAMELPKHSLTVLTWSTKMGLTATPASIVFPDTVILQTSNQSMTVTNEATTSGPRSVLSLTPVSGDTTSFQLLTSLPISNIAPGSSTSLQFRFVPTTNGPKSASYLLNTNDPNFPTVPITLTGNATGDDDNDGVPVPTDLFPWNPNDWADADGDGMGDNFENWIISTAQTDGNTGNDGIDGFDDVLRDDDFDNDGFTNYEEFLYRTDPTDGTTSLSAAGLLPLAAGVAGILLIALRQHQRAQRKRRTAN